MGSRPESSETIRNKCAACYRQYNKMEHLVEHMRTSFHSIHEPKCGICQKHCRSLESLREHLIGPLPKIDCARIFGVRGCDLCLRILDSPHALRIHCETCQLSRPAPGLVSRMPRLCLHGSSNSGDFGPRSRRMRAPQVIALACKMVGGGSDGSIDLCARVCFTDEDENIIFHTYVKPLIWVTNYRYEVTGIRPEHLRDAMALKQVQREMLDLLYNGESMQTTGSDVGKARILVGHGLDHDLECLGINYPGHLIRYDIQTGMQDPYEDSVAAMRIYLRMRSQPHPADYNSGSGDGRNCNNFPNRRQRELERMTPDALMKISVSDYYCWCLDSKQNI